MSRYDDEPRDWSSAELYEMECDAADRSRKADKEDAANDEWREADESDGDSFGISPDVMLPGHVEQWAQEIYLERHRPEPDEYPRG